MLRVLQLNMHIYVKLPIELIQISKQASLNNDKISYNINNVLVTIFDKFQNLAKYYLLERST